MATQRAFNPGFQLSVADGLVLLLATTASWALRSFDVALSIAVAFTVAHFFLFCNVLRMARSLELVWAAVFVVLSSSTLLIGIPTWPQTWVISGVCTVVLTLIQVRHPSYHGVFWQRLNPALPSWWAEQV